MLLLLLYNEVNIHFSFADACHVGSPACENVAPDFNKTFGECCNNYDPLQRQDSFGSGPGVETCIRCATLGKSKINKSSLATMLCINRMPC